MLYVFNFYNLLMTNYMVKSGTGSGWISQKQIRYRPSILWSVCVEGFSNVCHLCFRPQIMIDFTLYFIPKTTVSACRFIWLLRCIRSFSYVEFFCEVIFN